MSKEKQNEEILELSSIIGCAVNDWCDFCEDCHKDGYSPTDTLEEYVAVSVLTKGYRKQSEGEWIFETNHYFNDYGDLKVYATAKCSECEKPYPFNPTVASEFVERPETLSAYEDWDIDVEPIKAEVLERAKSNKRLYPFCPNCGAKMKGVSHD